jgi:hypothetical protein
VHFLRCFAAVSIAALAFAGAACEKTKSSNPLSPTVAGPIPGVEIGTPKILEPASGTKIAVDKQPVTLLIENAGTTGVRPISYMFEVATDAAFNTKVFARDSIAPGDAGRTSLRLPDALQSGRTYFWRAKAQDGANTGAFSPMGSFDVFTPVVINAPDPVSPAAGVTVDTLRPTLVVSNAPRSGPAGAISYSFEVADNEAFANRSVFTVGEGSTQTSLAAPGDVPYNVVYYWRVRAFDPTTVGPYSATRTFRTPAAPAPTPIPIPAPGPAPAGPVPGDALNLSTAQVYNSPADVASWAPTAKITSISMSPSSGLDLEFTTKNSWPDVTPPGWDGPLQYTVWAVVNIGGQWYTSGFIQMWRGRPSTGAPILSEFAANWAYDARWGPMAGYRPHAGEQMGFFVTAGNARGEGGVSSLKERSNVVLVTLPAGDSGFFPF